MGVTGTHLEVKRRLQTVKHGRRTRLLLDLRQAGGHGQGRRVGGAVAMALDRPTSDRFLVWMRDVEGNSKVLLMRLLGDNNSEEGELQRWYNTEG